MSIYAVISKDGLVGYKVLFQPFNQETFQLHLSEIIAILGSTPYQFVMDNICFHKTATVMDWFRGVPRQQYFTPPYSPFLSPIEECFSMVAYLVK